MIIKVILYHKIALIKEKQASGHLFQMMMRVEDFHWVDSMILYQQ